ncbi:MAG: dipeptide/oligopeptide/nickel ABC transporter ATP-binding protein [Chloroflexi bacterium]|nr:MAG: dipeptide/oligopeptide/nickel ABC transporter ATP-binding protein [Chloroflexota bacterium]
MVTEAQTIRSESRSATGPDRTFANRVLDVRDLRVSYQTPRGPVRAVNGVSFFLRAGERLGLVGESGSGKTTTALSLMRLIQPPAVIEGGQVLLDGKDLLSLSEEEMRRARFAEIALIPQGAMNSLNPMMKVGEQLRDTMRAHLDGESGARRDLRIQESLESVGLRPDVMQAYPHELSGGMKQRVCIAMGILLSPKVIIADEPTSALDVVVQRQVMETLGRVQNDLGASIILVGHDMGLMAQFVDRVGVMYGGKLVEVGPVRDIFKDPLHPYTQLLIGSLPTLQSKEMFKGIPGLTPSLLTPPPGCMFHPRCPKAMAHCSVAIPPLEEIKPDRWVACHLYNGSQP